MSYEELAAKALRPVPTLTQAEEVLKRDFPLKLKPKTYINLWNTPEISQFRGVQESLDEEAKNREDAEQERVEIRRAAREAGVSTVDMSMLHEALIHQRQSANALAANARALTDAHQASLLGMAREQSEALERLTVAQSQAENRARMAASALDDVRDTMKADMDRMRELLERNGIQRPPDVPAEVAPARTAHDDKTLHNEAMAMLNTHAHQFGAFMQQQSIGQERMMQILMEYLRRHKDPPQPIVVMSGSGPPPAPPGAGAVAVPMEAERERKRPPETMIETGPPPPQPPAPPAPKPIPVPKVESTVPKPEYHSIATPRAREKSRSPPPARPPPAGLNPAPALPAPMPVPQQAGSSTDPPQAIQVFNPAEVPQPPPFVPQVAPPPVPKKRATKPAKDPNQPPKKRGRPSKEDMIMRDPTLSADEKMDKLLELQKKKNKKLEPKEAPESPRIVKDKITKRTRKATSAVRDSTKVMIKDADPEEPINKYKLAPKRAGPPRGQKPVIRKLALQDAPKALAMKKPRAKAKGRPRKAVDPMPEPEFA